MGRPIQSAAHAEGRESCERGVLKCIHIRYVKGIIPKLFAAQRTQNYDTGILRIQIAKNSFEFIQVPIRKSSGSLNVRPTLTDALAELECARSYSEPRLVWRLYPVAQLL